jgi:hypothetical protein
MHTKNEWPWAGLINTKLRASDSLIEKMINLWNSTDWGNDFENYKRPSFQDAIYPDTRTRQNSIFKSEIDLELREISNLAYSELQTIFNKDTTVAMSELNCLVPKGKVPWHHDRMAYCYYGTRIILPLLNVENIKFYFSSWNEYTPTDNVNFPAINFMNTDDIVSLSVEAGYFYIFNHRVPHQTMNFSDKPRAMFTIDLIDKKNIEKCSELDSNIPIFKEISDEEKTKIIPAIN